MTRMDMAPTLVGISAAFVVPMSSPSDWSRDVVTTPDIVDVAADSLEAADDRISVETATSARDGLDRLAQNGFDAVVSDYDMPKMNGVELLDAIRETNPDYRSFCSPAKGAKR